MERFAHPLIYHITYFVLNFLFESREFNPLEFSPFNPHENHVFFA
jgi:hypothetical protein